MASKLCVSFMLCALMSAMACSQTSRASLCESCLRQATDAWRNTRCDERNRRQRVGTNRIKSMPEGALHKTNKQTDISNVYDSYKISLL